MATPSHVELTPSTAGIYHMPKISTESCTASSALLQQNHDNHHIYMNQSGFHNHIAHHLLTLFALGATPTEIQAAFDGNKGYQRSQYPVNPRNVEDMSDPEKFQSFLGKEQYYHDYAIFFRQEMDAKGWPAVVREQLLARTAHADRMLTRLYAGFYHPLIHLGFGIEFQQPAIIVEALAQAATHDNWTAEFLLGAEKLAAEAKTPSKSMVELLEACRANDTIRLSPRWDDGNKVRDGVLVRAKEETVQLTSQWRVRPDELERKTAEMINADAYFAGAAQHPPKQVKFDFFYIHSMNSSIFFSAFLQQDWISVEDKCRLLEWKGRFDLALYVSRGSPQLKLDEITKYRAKRPEDGWADIVRRVDALEDDGHASKLVRALAHGEQVCKKYEQEAGDDFRIKGEMWLQLGHMAIDSVEVGYPGGHHTNWVRNCGFDQAWEKIPDRARL